MQAHSTKTIGLIGGMSWESTAVYYRLLNEAMRRRHGGHRSAEILLHSVDFDRIVGWQKTDRWDLATRELAAIGTKLAAAGADCVLICTNTMHLVADEVARQIPVPLINIIDVTAEALRNAGHTRPLLLATRYTMEHGFYLDRMRARHGIDVMVPEKADRDLVHRVIFDELCCGIVDDASRAAYVDIVERGKAAGADAVILGCTEIGLLVNPAQVSLPAFDSTVLHADAALTFAEEGLAKVA